MQLSSPLSNIRFVSSLTLLCFEIEKQGVEPFVNVNSKDHRWGLFGNQFKAIFHFVKN